MQCEFVAIGTVVVLRAVVTKVLKLVSEADWCAGKGCQVVPSFLVYAVDNVVCFEKIAVRRCQCF